MEIKFYPITIEEHYEGGFHAKCPIIQGAWADGETIEEAIANLKSILVDILEYRESQTDRVLRFIKRKSWSGLALAV
mgnify:CR=1 FL=1